MASKKKVEPDRCCAAAMLEAPGVTGDTIEVKDGPCMIDDGLPMIRVCSAAHWKGLQAHTIKAAPRAAKLVPGVSGRTAHVGEVVFHLSWIREIEKHHGPLRWRILLAPLRNGRQKGVALAGYKAGKRVAYVAQLGDFPRKRRASK